ncbi:hypothetical protein EI94DRAFT_1809254 [Lactarius quietus]|nr:hypothetical protein EI94DRAFT_1809254 [Lactarius quietus]
MRPGDITLVWGVGGVSVGTRHKGRPGGFADVDPITSHIHDAEITALPPSSPTASVAEDKKAPAILWRTSGVEAFMDDGKERKHNFISKDEGEAEMRAITPQMPHHEVGHLIRRALDEGYTESYIIHPTAIIGPGTGPVPSASLFLHFMIQVALEDLFDLLFARIQSHDDAKASPYSRNYFVSMLISLRLITAIFACVLKNNGKLEEATTYGHLIG